MSLFELNAVSHDFGAAPILTDVSFQVAQGENFGIIGPNGSGKSTLLQAISGLLRPKTGNILFKGRPVSSYNKKQLARQIAVLEQEGTPLLDFSVEDIVSMGRYPWLKPFADMTSEDFGLIKEVLHTLDLWQKRCQPVNTLSGGERQLVALARAMVQQPEVLILDEPTTYLDIGHQMLVMEHVRRWHHTKGISVIVVLHDLNLAAQFCDKLVLMEAGKVRTWGPVAEVLREQTIADVYKANFVMLNHPILGVPQILLTKDNVKPGLQLVHGKG